MITNTRQTPIKVCKYCNGLYTKTHNRQTYCTPECRDYARMDQKREWWQKSYHAHPTYYNSKKVGTGWLGAHRHGNDELEKSAIQAEFKRLKIKA